MKNQEIEFSRPIDIKSLGDRKQEIEIKADEKELKKLKKRMIVSDINFLNAKLSLYPKDNGSKLDLKGHISSKITQNCVVTLEPVEQTIEEDFEIFFDSDVTEEDLENMSLEEIIESHIVEPLSPKLDVGEVVSEQLALAIDPYPRKKDAVFDFCDNEEEKNADNPFSVLSKLKKS